MYTTVLFSSSSMASSSGSASASASSRLSNEANAVADKLTVEFRFPLAGECSNMTLECPRTAWISELKRQLSQEVSYRVLTYSCNPSVLQFVYRDSHVSDTDTLESISYVAGSIINVHIAMSTGRDPMSRDMRIKRLQYEYSKRMAEMMQSKNSPQLATVVKNLMVKARIYSPSDSAVQHLNKNESQTTKKGFLRSKAAELLKRGCVGIMITKAPDGSKHIVSLNRDEFDVMTAARMDRFGKPYTTPNIDEVITATMNILGSEPTPQDHNSLPTSEQEDDMASSNDHPDTTTSESEPSKISMILKKMRSGKLAAQNPDVPPSLD
jgi:hypothetical protein